MTGLVMVEQPASKALESQRIDSIPVVPAPQVVQRLVVGVTVIAGPPNSGKSAMALDLSLAVCARSPWFGRKVNGGPVLYVAAEASGSIVLRAKATIERKWDDRALPLYIATEVPALGSELVASIDAERVVASIEEISSAEGDRVAMCVIDTAAAVLAGCDENGAGMTLLARSAHHIHTQTGAAVVLLHHPGKADSNSLRGHSSLAGAADAILLVEADPLSKVRTIRTAKARDFATGEAICFELETIQLTDPDVFGDPVTTVLVRPTDQLPDQAVKAAGKNQAASIVALKEWSRLHPGDTVLASPEIGALLKAQGVTAKRKPEALNWLVNAGILNLAVGGYTLNRDSL